MLLVLSLAGCLLSTYRIMDHTIAYTDKTRIRFYQWTHYTRDYDVKRAHQALKRIPADAIVSAQSPFLPHLALRDNIYQFPKRNDAAYIVVSTNEGAYPLGAGELMAEILKLKASAEWAINYEDDGLIIFERRN